MKTKMGLATIVQVILGTNALESTELRMERVAMDVRLHSLILTETEFKIQMTTVIQPLLVLRSMQMVVRLIPMKMEL